MATLGSPLPAKASPVAQSLKVMEKSGLGENAEPVTDVMLTPHVAH